MYTPKEPDMSGKSIVVGTAKNSEGSCCAADACVISKNFLDVAVVPGRYGRTSPLAKA